MNDVCEDCRRFGWDSDKDEQGVRIDRCEDCPFNDEGEKSALNCTRNV